MVELDPKGLPSAIEWPRPGGRPRRHEVSFLCDVPGMALDLAQAIADRYDADDSDATVETLVGHLRNVFVPALRTRLHRNMTLAALDAPAHNALIRRLQALEWVESTKAHCFGTFKAFMSTVDGTVPFPPNPFKQTSRTREAKGLTASELKVVLLAAAAEVASTVALYRAFRDPADPLWSTPAREVLEVAREVRALFGVRFPTFREVRSRSPGLAARLHAVGFERVRSLWGPTKRNVGGFLVLFLFFFRLNPALLATLKTGEIDLVDDEVVIAKRKRRGGVRVLPGYPDGSEPIGPRVLLDFLRDWTKPVRMHAPPDDQSLIVLTWETRKVGRLTNTLANPGLKLAFRSFRTRHSLPRLTPKLLKPSAIDVIALETGEDAAWMTTTGRHTPAVAQKHYRSRGSFRRAQIRYALAQSVRRRDYRARPAVAATGRVGVAGGATAATPGWRCAKPFDRTYSSAPPGELCDAVGRCPACPHGEPDLSSIHSLALTLALRKAVIIEIEKGEPALIGKWGPVLDRLDVVWLPAFAPGLRDVPLPPVPSLTGCLA